MDSQANSQAGSQAYRCLGWCDREVGVGVEARFEVKVRDNFWSPMWSELVGETSPSSAYSSVTIIKMSSLKLISFHFYHPNNQSS